MSRTDATRISDTGLTVVSDSENPNIDIVFVHGFTGHPRKTWSQDADLDRERPPKTRRSNNPFNGRLSDRDDNAVFWPRDLLPATIPGARVLSYGYDTHVTHKFFGPPQNPQTINDIARNFLIALASERQARPSRPLLFIAHSLGGLVVKEMLLMSKDGHQRYLRTIFESTIGIVFFGTPHCGADPRGVARSCLETIAKILLITVPQQIVDALSPTAQSLRELNDKFKPVAEKEGWMVHSFQEQYAVRGLGCKVVEDASSYIGSMIETREHIAQNHMEMCRFAGPGDVEYRKVAAALQRIVGSLLVESPPTSTATSLSPEARKALRDALDFDQIDSRYNNVKRAHTRTCTWMNKRKEYLDWLDPAKLVNHHGFLWIKGKAGTGKSTLMKFAFDKARRSMRDKIVLSFFFHARGFDIEKSAMGMYRSLLMQLLCAVPELESVFDSLSPTTAQRGKDIVWTIELLKGLFAEAIQSLGQRQLVCFVDALDECSQDEVHDMVTTFEDLGKTALDSRVQFLVCFASRYYPHISIAHSIELKLEDMDGHTKDIETYIDDRLKIDDTDISGEIKPKLNEKARGVFMWVALVVDILNEEYEQGGVHKLQERLEDIPEGLESLFEDILTRDSRRKGELLLCIQWVLFAKRHLRPLELYFAIRSSLESGIPAPNPGNMMDDHVRRYILSSSKGLVEIIEIKKSKTSVVQFIHETVRDFLTKHNGLGVVGHDFGPTFEAQSHERLKKCCMKYLKINHILPPRTPATSDMSATPELASDDYPLLEYATQNVLYHADRAATAESQRSFLEEFPVQRWIELYNPFEKARNRRYHISTGLLYILAEQNLSTLIRTWSPTTSVLSSNLHCRYGSPFFAALATDSKDAVKALCYAELSLGPSPPLERLCRHCVDFPEKIPKLSRQFEYDPNPARLIYRAIKLGAGKELTCYLITKHDPHQTVYLEVMDMAVQGHNLTALLSVIELYAELFRDVPTPREMKAFAKRIWFVIRMDHGRYDRSQWDAYDYLLSAAVLSGNSKTVRSLLQRPGIDLKKHQHESGWSILHIAARKGYVSTVTGILEGTRIDPNGNCPKEGTPLFVAASEPNEIIVKKLLETNRVVPDARGPGGQTPLGQAASYFRDKNLKMLLDTKRVDVNHQDIEGRSALSLAMSRIKYYPVIVPSINTIQLLLEHGANPNLQDKEGLTALDRFRHAMTTCQLRERGELNKVQQLLKDHGALSGKEVL